MRDAKIVGELVVAKGVGDVELRLGGSTGFVPEDAMSDLMTGLFLSPSGVSQQRVYGYVSVEKCDEGLIIQVGDDAVTLKPGDAKELAKFILGAYSSRFNYTEYLWPSDEVEVAPEPV